ncbi:MAG: hypothetical protein HY553_10755 [Elusimicrobia bacterium]|nr:hypothetical protein [Elusimicrobiota bacterium]
MITETFSGDARRRGEQHGERFGPAIRESGILDFFRDYCESEVLGGRVPVASAVLHGLHRRTIAGFSPEARDSVAGFCRAAGLGEPDVLKALVMPDVINYLVGIGGRLTSAPVLGCTSVAAWGGHAPGGRFVYGRNLDFIGNGLWDKNQFIARHRPEHGIPYVSLSSAGSLLDGITGINEEGLTVDLHQHLTSEVDLWPSGRPILDLATEVLSRARTIDEAIGIIGSNPTTSGWSLVLTHWKARRAAVAQRTPRNFAVRRFDDGLMAWTNTYCEPALRARELEAPAFRESSRLREARAWQLLREHDGKITPAVVASILGDHHDLERGRTRAFAQCIAYPNNLTSVVIAPEDGVLWLGEGPAPMCDSAFVKVPLWQGTAVTRETIAAGAPLSEGQREAVRRYVDGMKAWQLRHDSGAATEALGCAAASDPQDPAFRLMHGLFQLIQRDYEGAARSFGEGAAHDDLPHRRASQRYWHARSLDVLGRRAEAQSLYAEAARGATFTPLRTAAEAGASRRRKSIGRILPDFIHADAFAY